MRAVLPFLILLGLAACSREPVAPAPAAGNKPAPARPASLPTAEDSVGAVLQSSPNSSVTVRFALDGKPTVGKTCHLRLDVSGNPGSLSLRLRSEAMVIDPEGATVVLADDGKAVSQTFVLKPRTAGIAEIEVHVQPPGDDTPEVVYAVPLLVEGAAAK